MIKNNILKEEHSMNPLNNKQNEQKIRQDRFKNRGKNNFLNDLKQEINISGNIENFKKKS